MEAADGDLDASALSRRAISMARGNWFDCTPTRQTSPRPPPSRIAARSAPAGRACWSRPWRRFEADVGSKRAAVAAILGQPIHDGERIRRNRRAKPLNDITVVVVVDGLTR